ncbi:hypothetical protein ABPG72_014311 [Tetrahymena utriculariae]
MNLQATLQKHKSREGWLEKKSPRLLVGFQKRYFSIGEDKEQFYLLYDKSLPQKDKIPKGAILICQIDKIVTKEDSKEFSFKFSERNFILKAPSIQTKKEWIETIQFLKEYLVSKGASSDELGSKKAWRFNKLDSDKQRNLRLNQEKKNQDEEEVKKIEVKDEEMQKIKGIRPYFEKYEEEVLQNHVVQGFLYKKKEKLHTKIIQPTLRWFFFFSKYNLTENASHTNDFDLDDLPPFINPNVLYYYDSKYDDSKMQGEIHIKNIISIKKIDLKVEDGNILKKGVGFIGNQMVKVINKTAELTFLDKIGAHIHQFEFIFQIVVKKGNKETTHNFYSESLIQIEKWVNSLQKAKDIYHQEQEEIEKQNQTAEGESPNKTSDTNQTGGDGEKENQSPTKSIEEEETPVGNTSNETKLLRNQIIFKQSLKIKLNSKLKIGWKDKICIVKRQIIQLFNNEQDVQNGEVDDYIIIKDIEKISQDEKLTKFHIETKKHEQRRFKLKSEQDCAWWVRVIQLLMFDENVSLEELREQPQASPKESKQVDTKNVSINDTKNDLDSEMIFDPKNRPKSNGSFQFIDDLRLKAERSSRSDTQVERKTSFFQKLFSCCIDPRQEDFDSYDSNPGTTKLQKKLIS